MSNEIKPLTTDIDQEATTQPTISRKDYFKTIFDGNWPSLGFKEISIRVEDKVEELVSLDPFPINSSRDFDEMDLTIDELKERYRFWFRSVFEHKPKKRGFKSISMVSACMEPSRTSFRGVTPVFNKNEALKKIHSLQIRPSFVIQVGDEFFLDWLLKKPVLFFPNKEKEEIIRHCLSAATGGFSEYPAWYHHPVPDTWFFGSEPRRWCEIVECDPTLRYDFLALYKFLKKFRLRPVEADFSNPELPTQEFFEERLTPEMIKNLPDRMSDQELFGLMDRRGFSYGQIKAVFDQYRTVDKYLEWREKGLGDAYLSLLISDYPSPKIWPIPRPW